MPSCLLESESFPNDGSYDSPNHPNYGNVTEATLPTSKNKKDEI